MTNPPSDVSEAPHPLRCWASGPWRYFLVSLYWLPVALFWGMMLAQILPARVADIAGEAHKGAYLGVISVIGAGAAAVIQLIIGPISDTLRARCGRRRPFLLIGTLIACIGMLWFGWAQSFTELTAAYFLIQLFLNLAVGPYIAYMPDLVPPTRQGAASAVMGLIQLLGKAGGPLLAGLAVARATQPYAQIGVLSAAQETALAHARMHAFQELLVLDVALFAVCALVTLAALPDPPATTGLSSLDAVRGIFVWRRKVNINFFRLLLSRGIYNIGFYMALAYLQYYVRDSLGLGQNYAIVLTLMQVATIGGALLGTFPAGIMADRGSKKRVVAISCAFSAAAMIAFAFAPSAHFAVSMAVAFGIGYGAFCAVDWAFACNLLPEGSPAKFMAIWSLSDTVPQLLTPLFGPVADSLNRSVHAGYGWRAAMLVAAVSIIGGAIAIRSVEEKRAVDPADPSQERSEPASIRG